MSRRIAHLLLLALLLLTAACGSDDGPDAAANEGFESYGPDAAYAEAPRSDAYEPGPPQASGAGRRIEIVDHGLRLTRGTQVVPHGWEVLQNIATDPNTGQYLRYVNETRGPDGELIRGLQARTFSTMLGTSMEEIWREAVRNGLPDVQNVSLGNLQRSPTVEQLREFRRVAQIWEPRGMQMQGFEAPIRGTRNGAPVEGIVHLIVFSSPQMPGVGSVQPTVLLNAPGRTEETLRISVQIANSYRSNPEFEQRLEAINARVSQQQQAAHQQRMASSQAAHQQRMAANQQRFNAHQQMMQDRSAVMDQQHQQYMGQLRNDNTSAWSGSDYSSHDYYIDGIHEQSSFQDPYSGQQMTQDGQYDYWYQNNLGEYYGTDDPSFDPNSMQGNWEQIEPLTP